MSVIGDPFQYEPRLWFPGNPFIILRCGALDVRRAVMVAFARQWREPGAFWQSSDEVLYFTDPSEVGPLSDETSGDDAPRVENVDVSAISPEAAIAHALQRPIQDRWGAILLEVPPAAEWESGWTTLERMRAEPLTDPGRRFRENCESHDMNRAAPRSCLPGGEKVRALATCPR